MEQDIPERGACSMTRWMAAEGLTTPTMLRIKSALPRRIVDGMFDESNWSFLYGYSVRFATQATPVEAF